jgi:hypothetical protein
MLATTQLARVRNVDLLRVTTYMIERQEDSRKGKKQQAEMLQHSERR